MAGIVGNRLIVRQRLNEASRLGPLLRGEILTCWRCDVDLKNIQVFREHLQMHFDEQVAASKKRKYIDLTEDGDDVSGVEIRKVPRKVS